MKLEGLGLDQIPERQADLGAECLLEFHRREAKPQYWAMFHRQDMTDEELVEDPESIGRVARNLKRKPVPDKQSLIHTFDFPAQDGQVVGDRLQPLPFRPGVHVQEVDHVDHDLHRSQRGREA